MLYLNRDLKKINVRLEFHSEICAYLFKCTESVYLPRFSSKTDSQGRCTTLIPWFCITGLHSGLVILAEIKKNCDPRDEVLMLELGVLQDGLEILEGISALLP